MNEDYELRLFSNDAEVTYPHKSTNFVIYGLNLFQTHVYRRGNNMVWSSYNSALSTYLRHHAKINFLKELILSTNSILVRERVVCMYIVKQGELEVRHWLAAI